MHYGKMKPQFCDERDGKEYVYVTIGEQIWMAENLDYNAGCYNNSYCTAYGIGRLYNWATAKDVCPKGWHLPSKAEWDILAAYIKSDKNCNSNCDAKHLKAISGWSGNGNGLDSYGFSAVPSGFIYSNSNFVNIGQGHWWFASEQNNSGAYSLLMSVEDGTKCDGYDKSLLFGVRCVHN